MPSDPASFVSRKGPNSPARVASSGRSAYFELLRNRNFRFWFASSFTSSVGDWMGFVALTALMTQLFENSSTQLFAVGGLLMIRLLPSAIFGPIAGVIADRYDRRKVLVFTDMARAVVYFVIVFAGDVLAIFALTFIVECVSLLFLAAKDASLPQVVPDNEHLTEANQLNLLASYGTLPLGAVSTSIMIAVAGAVGGLVSFDVDPLRLALLIDSISFVFSGLLLFQVTIPGETERRQVREQADDQQGIIDEVREGLDFIRGFPLLRALISGIVGVFFGAGVVIGLGSVFLVSDLNQPAANWSILLSAVGGGLVVGIVVFIPVLRRFVQEEVFPIMLALVGVFAVATALSVNFTMALVIGSLLGGAAGVAVVQGYTLLQTYTEDATRARTFSLFYVLTRISLFAALGISPFVAGAIGSIGVATGFGVVTVTGTRLTLVLGGLIAMYFGLRTRTAIRQAIGKGDMTLKLGAAVVEPDPALAEAGGLFIAFEGGEGAGKSTQIQALAETLRAEGREVVVTREPGGAPLAERIRELVLDPLTTDMNDRTEALLIAAARADHVESTIRPALEEGKVVLCDRFIDSSLAYQGHARGLGIDNVGEVNRWAIDGVVPDAVVLLLLDADEGMARVEQRATERQAEEARKRGDNVVELPGAGIDRMERAGRDFHHEVAKGYLKLARQNGDRWLIVDASASAEVVHGQVRAGLHRWLPLVDDSYSHTVETDETLVVDGEVEDTLVMDDEVDAS